MTVLHVNSPLEAMRFNNLLKNGHTIVFYYMDGCGHCEAMKPEWEKFEQKVNDMGLDNIDVARVNYRMLSLVNGPKDFMGFPTIYVLENGMKKKEHNGERTEDAFSILLNEITNEAKVNISQPSAKKQSTKPKRKHSIRRKTPRKRTKKNKRGKKQRGGKKSVRKSRRQRKR